MTHEELVRTPEYWTAKIQIDLYNRVEQYLTDNNLNRTEFANKIGVTKGYVSQILNGEFDHRISNLAKLSLAIGCIPNITFIPCDRSENTLAEIVQNTMFDLSRTINCTLFLAKNTTKLSISQEELDTMGSYNLAI